MSAALASRPGVASRNADALDRYLHEISAYRPLPREEEARLARRIAEGDGEAVDALVRANLRFVVSVAKRYQHHGVPLPDLIAEGNLGLLRAARRFDPAQRVRFISYAVWWVRQSILQALAEQSRVVRVPPSRAGAVRRLGRQAAALEQTLGREPSAGELAEASGLSVAEVDRELAAARPHVSLDAPLVPGGDDTLVDLLADAAGPAPDAPLLDGALVETVRASLALLAPRQQRILRLYFGFDGDPRTLDEIGALLGITRERVRQLREKALSRLRKAATAAALAELR